jgi:hypothetical protein
MKNENVSCACALLSKKTPTFTPQENLAQMDVEPRLYRLRLLNGCDSQFLVIQFFARLPAMTSSLILAVW